jgi:hypothetical protein
VGRIQQREERLGGTPARMYARAGADLAGGYVNAGRPSSTAQSFAKQVGVTRNYWDLATNSFDVTGSCRCGKCVYNLRHVPPEVRSEHGPRRHRHLPECALIPLHVPTRADHTGLLAARPQGPLRVLRRVHHGAEPREVVDQQTQAAPLSACRVQKLCLLLPRLLQVRWQYGQFLPTADATDVAAVLTAQLPAMG